MQPAYSHSDQFLFETGLCRIIISAAIFPQHFWLRIGISGTLHFTDFLLSIKTCSYTVPLEHPVLLIYSTRLFSLLISYSGNPSLTLPPPKTNIAPVIGGVVGGLLALAVIIGLIVFFYCRGTKNVDDSMAESLTHSSQPAKPGGKLESLSPFGLDPRVCVG